MILDRTWNKYNRQLVISYTDKDGNKQFFSKTLRYIGAYEYDENGEYETWNGRRANKIYKDTSKYIPNEFNILEYLYELPENIRKKFEAQYFPKLYSWDIETEFSDEFPYPEQADYKVTAISVVGPDLSCIVYGLNDISEESISTFRKRYLDWIKDNEFASALVKRNNWNPRVFYKYFPDEKDMLKHFMTIIVPKVPCLAGWNSYNFDWNYIIHRLQKLFPSGEYKSILRKSSPTGEIGTVEYTQYTGEVSKLPAPHHSLILDYMNIVKHYDYILVPYESYSLDWVSSKAINAHKIKYNGTLQQLYEKDHDWYYYYNAIDSLLVELIHYKLKSFESPCVVSSITMVPIQKAFGQVALTNANVFEEFYKEGKKVVYNFNEIDRTKQPYKGAFCGCVPGRYELNVCDDFASLYPSQIQTCNLSFENIMRPPCEPDSLGREIPRKWTKEELDKFRKDPQYFVTLNGNVYKNDKDYAFKITQRNIKKSRDKYKYTGQRIDSELLTEIDRLIKEKESKQTA